MGTVGDVLTQVKSGVAQGQEVSLAALDQPLPTTSTTTRAGSGDFGGAWPLTGGGFGGQAAGRARREPDSAG